MPNLKLKQDRFIKAKTQNKSQWNHRSAEPGRKSLNATSDEIDSRSDSEPEADSGSTGASVNC